MSIIQVPDNKPLDPKATINVDPMLFAGFRLLLAHQRGFHKNILVRVVGGIGDAVTAEPAIRFAVNNFKGSQISVATHYPEMFQHLNLRDIFNYAKGEMPDVDKYLSFDTIYQDGPVNETIFHLLNHCVDYHSIVLWRQVMPIAERCVKLQPTPIQTVSANQLETRDVVIHPGKTWASRTMPVGWWNQVIKKLIDGGARPVIIGGDITQNGEHRSTLPVKTEGCLDLRNTLSLMESVALLQKAKVFLTNDSAPLHFAASGRAWIGYLSTVRHPETLLHYRNGGEFGWRMANFSKGWLWKELDIAPNNMKDINLAECAPSMMRSWLPEPEIPVDWALHKLDLCD